MSIVELEVRMDCNGCEKRIRKALSNLQGVDNIEIDMERQKVTVTGYVDQLAVLNAVRSKGKKAELWPYPYNPEYHPYVARYYQNQNQVSTGTASISTYNYEIHGYNGTVHGYYQSQLPSVSAPSLLDEQATSLFSDENPHACSVM